MIQSDFRYAHHPNDVKKYTTEELRQHFQIPTLFVKDEINLTYTMYDRFIAGGALPVYKPLQLNAIDELKANYFLERRELGIINVGGKGKVIVDGKAYEIGHKEALYVGRGHKDIYFEATEGEQPYFYLNSAPAHKAYPAKKVTLADAEVVELGDSRNCNERKINKLIVNSVVQTCQLQMGMTELKEGSIWNTMPPHTHARRMEVYFYFNLEDGQTVSHFMGQPQETRHVFMKNHQAIISPEWSIHSGAGTSNYTFIWGMAGENLDYTDMDGVQPHELR
jgi:4-deoxy-L-threo-5-hexosulose-uronate ketol-isomerase